MTKPIIRIHDLETNEIIDREMNDIEFKQYNKDQDAIAESNLAAQVEAEARKAEAEARTIARETLLTKLGITTEEAALLLS